jgi:hypothetical protein
MALKISDPVGNLNNNDFLDKNQKHGEHNSLICGFANTTGSLRSVKSFVTAYNSDGKTINHGFGYSG